MKKIIFFWGIFNVFQFIGYTQEPLQCQDATIALDENGEATITSSNVLVNTTGKLLGLNTSSTFDLYSFDLESNSLILDEDNGIFFSTFGESVTADINPVNTQIAILSGVIFEPSSNFDDVPDFDSFIQFFNLPEENSSSSSIDDIDSIFSFLNVPIFSFANDGDLYILVGGSLFFQDVNATGTFFQNIHFFEDIDTLNLDVGLTNDFENNRLIISSGTNEISLISFDLTTGITTPLFSYTAPNNCNAKAIEYIGNDTLIVTGNNFCDTIYNVNLTTQEVSILLQDDSIVNYQDLVFVEDQLENTTLSTFEFNCNNIGENFINVSYVQNEETITCESIITIIDPIQSECSIFNNEFILNAEEGEDTVALIDYTNIPEFSNSCGGLILEQTPTIGTIFDVGVTVPVIITAIDENGNESFCEFNIITDFSLDIDDFSLDQSITLFPNPTKGNITLQNNNDITLSEVIIYDSIGRIINSQQIDNTIVDTQISLENYPDGIYFVRINSENTNVVRRIIKQ